MGTVEEVYDRKERMSGKDKSSGIMPKSIVRMVAVVVLLIGCAILYAGIIGIGSLDIWMQVTAFFVSTALIVGSVMSIITGDQEWILLEFILSTF